MEEVCLGGIVRTIRVDGGGCGVVIWLVLSVDEVVLMVWDGLLVCLWVVGMSQCHFIRAVPN